MNTEKLPICRGIVSVVQTPFSADLQLDLPSLRRLLEDAITAGVNGFLAPVVASEAAFLAESEKIMIIEQIASVAEGKVPLIVGASAEVPDDCRAIGKRALESRAAAWLVAVPAHLYKNPPAILPFFQEVAEGIDLPLIIQDFEFNGPGMSMDIICRLRDILPTFFGVKIETAPAGPKYTQVREAFGPGFFISGGWAVPQFIEALDRGVDAMIPESSMIRVYKAIQRLYDRGDRAGAVALFRQLLPILAFTNQDVGHSILFFKKLLERKGLFSTANMRWNCPDWDRFSHSAAEELIRHYFLLENRVIEDETAE